MSLLVVTGPPGAGKSSVAPMLARDRTPSVLVAGDRFFDFLHRGGIDPWLPEAHDQNVAVVEAAAAAAGRLARDYFVVYEGLVDPVFLPTFLATSGVPELDYVVLLPDLDTCLQRVADRRCHGFRDADATRHMHAQFADAHLDSRHVLADTPATPGDVAALVRHRLGTGTLTVR